MVKLSGSLLVSCMIYNHQVNIKVAIHGHTPETGWRAEVEAYHFIRRFFLISPLRMQGWWPPLLVRGFLHGIEGINWRTQHNTSDMKYCIDSFWLAVSPNNKLRGSFRPLLFHFLIFHKIGLNLIINHIPKSRIQGGYHSSLCTSIID